MVSSLGTSSFNAGYSDPRYHEFENSLQRWLSDPAAGGKKQEAVSRIRETFENKSVELNLSDLYLTTLPDSIQHLTKLRELYLYNNQQMSQLPMALGELPGLAYLSIEGTQIPEEQRNRIMALCRAKRDRQAKDQLPSRLEMWKTYAKEKSDEEYELAFILEMTEDKQIIINEWLVRLARAKDFSTNQTKLAKTVCAILATLNTNSEFCDLFLMQAATNLENCGDRAAMALNEIYTSWKLHTLPEDTPLKDKLEVLRGISKTLTLRQCLAKILKEKGEGESVEIYLYYESTLREALGLETAVKGMSYPSIGKRDWIDVESLKKEVNARFIEELTALPIFMKLLEANEALKAQIDEITEKTSNEMQDALEKPGVTSEEQRKIVEEFSLLKNKRIDDLLYPSSLI